MTENSVINFGDLTKPATTLIEKISDAVGVVYEPTHVRRMAKAKADELKILAQAETEIEERAIRSWTNEQIKKQKNNEEVTRIAIEHLNTDAEPDKIENDWLSFFFDKACIVSDEQMRLLWGKILAGEAQYRGSYSRRTIDFVATMTKHEADKFTTLGRFCFMYGDKRRSYPLVGNGVVDFSAAIDAGFDYLDYQHLDHIGLIRVLEHRYLVYPKENRYGTVRYFDRSIHLSRPEIRLEENEEMPPLAIDKVVLTEIGQELIRICGAEYDQDFFHRLTYELTNQGFILDVN